MKAKKPQKGNRFTVTNMRARQAQSLVGVLDRIKSIKEADNIPIIVRKELDDAFQSIINAIVQGNRMEELPPRLFK